MIGTAALDCVGVRGYGIADRTFGVGLTPPPHAGTVPLPPPLRVLLVKLDKDVDLVDLAILSVVTLGVLSQLLLLIRLT